MQKENMDDRLQDFADLGKELLKKDGLWEDALSGLEKKSKPSNLKWLIIGLILIVAISIGYFVFDGQKEAERIPIAYYEALPTSLVPNVRANNDTPKTDLQKAVTAYGDKNFQEAEDLLTPLAKESNDDLAKLYLASIYIKSDKSKDATLLLDGINSSELSDYVQWYKALSLLSYDKGQAKSLLEKIANNKAHFRSKKAKEILRKEF